MIHFFEVFFFNINCYSDVLKPYTYNHVLFRWFQSVIRFIFRYMMTKFEFRKYFSLPRCLIYDISRLHQVSKVDIWISSIKLDWFNNCSHSYSSKSQDICFDVYSSSTKKNPIMSWNVLVVKHQYSR